MVSHWAQLKQNTLTAAAVSAVRKLEADIAEPTVSPPRRILRRAAGWQMDSGMCGTRPASQSQNPQPNPGHRRGHLPDLQNDGVVWGVRIFTGPASERPQCSGASTRSPAEFELIERAGIR